MDRRNLTAAAHVLLLCAAMLAATGCAEDAPPAPAESEVEPQSLWGVFWGAFNDELAGQPSAAELEPTARFEQAGIAFEHPALLRVRGDADHYPSWSLGRGDFELELHAPDSPMSAVDYIGLLAEVAGGDDAADHATRPAPAIDACGRRIEAYQAIFELFGDVHVFTGYDLPAPDGESRFLVFDDVPIDGEPSKVAAMTLSRVQGTLRCAEEAGS